MSIRVMKKKTRINVLKIRIERKESLSLHAK